MQKKLLAERLGIFECPLKTHLIKALNSWFFQTIKIQNKTS